MNKYKNLLVFFIIVVCPTFIYASSGHEFLPNLLCGLILIILGAKVGGDVAIRLKQPAVLGELGFGLLIGNIGLSGLGFLKEDTSLDILSELGVILLLFQVGLETNIHEMRKVGISALLSAILGVVVPFILGFLVSSFFLPDAETLVHIFVGATLTATSVGITARVLKDIGKIQTKEGQIILGAAVIDDVLGLLTLAVVTGLIAATNANQPFEIITVLKIVLLSVGFLIAAVGIGQKCMPTIFSFASKLKADGLLLAFSLSICFGMSLLASLAGLAPIVGAFTAGLILDPVQYKKVQDRTGEGEIEHLIEPISSLLVPIFFVVMGTKVDLSIFKNVDLLAYALSLTVVAIIGKQICGLGVLEKGLDRLAVGIGMIPRGEVGLIFVGIGSSLTLHGKPVIDSVTFGAVVIMVIITTMVTPPLITWKFTRK